MSDRTDSDTTEWLEASGLRHILRTLGLAAHPGKLGIGLAAILATLLMGWVLDAIWTVRGGVGETAIAEYTHARVMDAAYTEPKGDHGIFEVWRRHEQRSLRGLLHGPVPDASIGGRMSIRPIVMASPFGWGILHSLTSAADGVCWLFSAHTGYAIVFGLGMLLIWAFAGGAICRMAAVQFATEEKLPAGEALQFARKNLVGGFVLAPVIPLVLVLITMLFMVIGGAFLRIPYVGDLLGGVAFVLALIGGFVIAILLVGFCVGGSFFWPAVATEGQDAYDGFSRGMSYAFSKPWKTVLYAIIVIAYGAICWMIVNFFAALILGVTRGVVAFGTSPFGWWNRGDDAEPMSKLELLWPTPAPDVLYSWPEWSNLHGLEYFSAFMIGAYVVVVIAMMWSFLASFYFSGSTVLYFLLRRDVDQTELSEVYAEETEAMDETHPPPDAAPSPVGQSGSSTTPESQPSPETPEQPSPEVTDPGGGGSNTDTSPDETSPGA